MLNHLVELACRVPALDSCLENMEAAVDCLEKTFRDGCKILTCGNGGSAADAEHIVGELMKGFLLKRPLGTVDRKRLAAGGCPEELIRKLQLAIPAVSLVAGISLPTAFANDIDGHATFAQQVFGLGRAGDALFAISTSGNSVNVVWAAQIAKAIGVKVISFTGSRSNRLAEIADVAIKAPSESTPRIQEMHLAIYHALCAELEERLFGETAE